MFSPRSAILAVAALAAASLAAPASAQTVINLNGIDSISNYQAKQGYKIAAAYWESVLTNKATINLNVGFEALEEGVLAQAGSYRGDVAVTSVYYALAATGNSALDAAAVASLTTQLAAGGGYSVNALVSSVADVSVTINDTNRSFNNAVLYENAAVLKALGLTTYTGPDANITFSSSILFDFNPSDGVSAGASDFVGVAIHEIGHSLGFTSGVDYYDVYGCPSGPGCTFLTDAQFDDNSWMRTLDLFRYSSAGQLDWTVGTPSYFSIDNGLTEFNGNANFSSGAFNGDGWQASHWQAPTVTRPDGTFFTCNKANRVGIMNPYLCDGQGGDVKGADLAALDAMGWNLNVNVLANPNYSMSSGQIYSQLIGQVPEPSIWAMLILGFGVIGGSLRRRGRAQLRFA